MFIIRNTLMFIYTTGKVKNVCLFKMYNLINHVKVFLIDSS